jgi:hypothetical protein
VTLQKKLAFMKTTRRWCALLKALEAMEKWKAGTMTEEWSEIAFMGFELEAAFAAIGKAHGNK